MLQKYHYCCLLYTSKVENIVHREFDREKTLDVVVSDLTYVNVGGYWNRCV